ncbi:SH3 and PX-domain-containing 3 [Favolaschia claudopus]|uniref:SH3 and PX-domain-containing 3 n=1 Tax=Favolaschia claudopus TaxID=2862362 RepID=A0AAW0CQ91_9AGAR
MRRFLAQHAPARPWLVRLAVAATVVLVTGAMYMTISGYPSLRLVSYIPPTHTLTLGHPAFEDIREYERKLPQHKPPTFLTKTKPRYLFFPWEAWGTGWNNVFQEQLLNTHLSFLANRGYVFVDYIARDHPPFPDTLPNGTRHMLHIPMNAFTSGPTGGGSWGPGVDPSISRPISQRWWEVACPKERIVEVQLKDTMQELNITDSTTGGERLMLWAEKLRRMPEECVSVIGGTPFDYVFINTAKVVSLWDSYGHSPTLAQFAWSALITRAISRNFPLLSSSPPPPTLTPAPSRIFHPTDLPSTPLPLTLFHPLPISAPPLPGLLALHVRRGDYATHCPNLATWGSDYNTWNKFSQADIRKTNLYPALPDDLSVPPGMSRHDAALRHCWPEVGEIVARVREVRRDAEKEGVKELKTLYIATNAERGWLDGLVASLKEGEEGWERVATSRDMELAPDELAVSQAVDMGVLVSAEVFIGNGFSSVTSNVVQLRLAGGKHANTSRFW